MGTGTDGKLPLQKPVSHVRIMPGATCRGPRQTWYLATLNNSIYRCSSFMVRSNMSATAVWTRPWAMCAEVVGVAPGAGRRREHLRLLA